MNYFNNKMSRITNFQAIFRTGRFGRKAPGNHDISLVRSLKAVSNDGLTGGSNPANYIKNFVQLRKYFSNDGLTGGSNPANLFISSLRPWLLTLLLLLPAAAPHTNAGTEQPAVASHSISGYVSVKDGMDPSGLSISLFSVPGNFPGVPTEIVLTDSTGYFAFISAVRPPYLLKIEGSEGSGRVWFPALTPAAEKNISYPVTEKIVILHTNDQHFTHNKPDELKATLEEIRNSYDDVFLFSAGDIFVRHPLRWIVNGRLMRDQGWFGERSAFMINSMNELGYDLMTPGNHEFDYREPYTRQALDLADFPLIGANVEIFTDAFPPLHRYAILKTTTWRDMAVLGLTTVSGNKEGISENNILETVTNYISLRDSADLLVALTHIGLRRDRELAEAFSQFDLIVGGHSHDRLEEGEMINSVLIVHAGGNPHIVSDRHPALMGKVLLKMENGVIVSKEGRIIEILETTATARDQ